MSAPVMGLLMKCITFLCSRALFFSLGFVELDSTTILMVSVIFFGSWLKWLRNSKPSISGMFKSKKITSGGVLFCSDLSASSAERN